MWTFNSPLRWLNKQISASLPTASDIDGWISRWMDRWMDGWVAVLSVGKGALGSGSRWPGRDRQATASPAGEGTLQAAPRNTQTASGWGLIRREGVRINATWYIV